MFQSSQTIPPEKELKQLIDSAPPRPNMKFLIQVYNEV